MARITNREIQFYHASEKENTPWQSRDSLLFMDQLQLPYLNELMQKACSEKQMINENATTMW